MGSESVVDEDHRRASRRSGVRGFNAEEAGRRNSDRTLNEGAPFPSGMQRAMEVADFTAKAGGEKDSETQVAMRSIVTRGTC